MRAWLANLFLLGLILLVSLQIDRSAASLPELVADHFVAGGLANGYAAKVSYIHLMQALVIALPGLFGLLLPALLRLSGERIRLPNRDYWLAPPHYEATLAFLATGLRWLAVWQLLLLGYVHTLIVEANRLHPPRLAEGRFEIGMLLFVGGLVVWLLLVLWRFGRQPPRGQ
ncbi:hypothetical protein [Chitinimonas sp.]|uniref:hypothetical protein n=1 Tax=Chitinimonas sp. TaxID=1934313 RepID=UPI002F932873